MNYWDTEIIKSLSGLELKTYLNKKQIIRCLYHQSILSSADIASTLNISAPKSNAYIQELVNEGYVEYKGKGESIGGRKPNIYRLKKNSVYAIGIDMGLKFLRIAIFNEKMEKMDDLQLPSISFTNIDILIDLVYKKAQELIHKTKIHEDKIMGIGINMPGLIDSDKGINYTYLFDENKPLSKAFEETFKLPVFIENDTKARTLAEMRFGAAKNHENALVLQVDWGLGLGMILNGKLYKGNSGFAGEFGHMPINPEGELCNCGKIGCIETMASGRALVRLAQETLSRNPNSKLYSKYMANNNQLMPSEIIDTALEGDHLSITLINNVSEALGQGIAYLIQILNPEIVVLGGVMAQAGDHLVLPIEHTLYKFCLPKLREDSKIVISPLGNDIGIIGSAIVVLERILEHD
ncbi:MAG: ROK family transcriptional regulator [Salinivirgaceae bacterium]|jgi:N-acetylglucosamine repressor|nr:ROK family transcriptional regulator [Salinivirgaceae bacterium]